MMKHYTAIEAAERVDVAYSTMREHVRAGKVQAKRKGRALSIKESELRRVYPDAFAADDIAEEAADIAADKAADFTDDTADTADTVTAKAAEGPHVYREQEALAVEAEVLRVKLEAAEQAHDATRRELEGVRDSFERTQHQLDESLACVRSLTEEMKGLTIALHHEQNQRLALEAHVTDESEEEEEKKRGFLRRVLARRPQRKRGKFARVGPS
jgi:hypothetical protein